MNGKGSKGRPTEATDRGDLVHDAQAEREANDHVIQFVSMGWYQTNGRIVSCPNSSVLSRKEP